jgi:SAM-dependent methyltransferase
MMNPSEFANIANAEREHWWYRGMRRILDGFLAPHATAPVRRVLEAGCGTGYQSKVFTERYHWNMFPVDLGWEGLEYARALQLERLTQANIAHLPFRNEVFDAVASLDVLVHFGAADDGPPIREMVRVLAPGGLLVLRVSALDILRSRHSQFAFERQRYTKTRLVESVEQQGIRVLRCSYANSLLLPVALFKFRVWEPLRRCPPASGVGPLPKWLDRILYGALRLESRLIGAGWNLPVGQSLVLVGRKPERHLSTSSAGD